MKQLLFVLIPFFITQGIFAQEVSISISLSWEKSNLHISEEYDTVLQPYLCIEYKNLSSDSIYIPRTAYGCNELLLVLSNRFLTNSYSDKYNSNVAKKNFWKQYNIEYDVGIDHFSHSVVVDRHTDEDEVESTLAYNSRIDIIQTYISEKNGFKYKAKDYLLNKTDVEEIDRYIFLNPKETIIDKFNLVAFMILGGSYTFHYDTVPCETKFFGEWDEKKKGLVDINYHFEEKKNDYRLFCGSVIPASLKVSF